MEEDGEMEDGEEEDDQGMEQAGQVDGRKRGREVEEEMEEGGRLWTRASRPAQSSCISIRLRVPGKVVPKLAPCLAIRPREPHRSWVRSAMGKWLQTTKASGWHRKPPGTANKQGERRGEGRSGFGDQLVLRVQCQGPAPARLHLSLVTFPCLVTGHSPWAPDLWGYGLSADPDLWPRPRCGLEWQRPHSSIRCWAPTLPHVCKCLEALVGSDLL